MFNQRISQPLWRYGAALGGVAVVTAILAPFQPIISSTIVALALILSVLLTATFIGRNPAFLASVAGALCFNFFFLPPLYTLTISEPINWIALAAFLITALVAGELSAFAQRRAAEAESRQREIERLYTELQAAFEQASHAEALRQSEKLKSALLDAVTHDLRTPLTSIKAAITTIINDSRLSDSASGLGEEGRQEFFEVINEETDRLNNFIEGMVELARLEAGAVNQRRLWSGIDEIIGAAIERAEKLLTHHCIKLEIERELPSVRVDARALAEVVYTLLDNAAKYSPPNSTVTIKVSRAEAGMLVIAVTDEGRGIAPEMRERVFEKFFRAALDEREKQIVSVGGLGLGLAIARGIVESHGGSIWVSEGANNRGTTVSFSVPVGDEDK